jgi:hypothetical protein
VTGSELAWELAEVGASHLDATERDNLYVAIASGETFLAVESLMRAVVGNRVALHAETITRLRAWLDGYRDHPDERGLRRLIAKVDIHTDPLPPAPTPLSTVYRHRRPRRSSGG